MKDHKRRAQVHSGTKKNRTGIGFRVESGLIYQEKAIKIDYCERYLGARLHRQTSNSQLYT